MLNKLPSIIIKYNIKNNIITTMLIKNVISIINNELKSNNLQQIQIILIRDKQITINNKNLDHNKIPIIIYLYEHHYNLI